MQQRLVPRYDEDSLQWTPEEIRAYGSTRPPIVTVDDYKATHCECPCCHGQRHLVVHDELRGWTQLNLCTHCMGKGEVPA